VAHTWDRLLPLLLQCTATVSQSIVDPNILIYSQYVPAAVDVLSFLVKIRELWTNRRNLTYAIWSERRLGSVAERGRTRILSNDPGKSLVRMRLRIWNAGGQAIRREDFDNCIPIHVIFSDAVKLEFAAVSCPGPQYLRAESCLNPELNGIQIEPLLLNSRDRIQLDLLLSSSTLHNVEVHARIAGVKEVHRARFPRLWFFLDRFQPFRDILYNYFTIPYRAIVTWSVASVTLFLLSYAVLNLLPASGTIQLASWIDLLSTGSGLIATVLVFVSFPFFLVNVGYAVKDVVSPPKLPDSGRLPDQTVAIPQGSRPINRGETTRRSGAS
jgi:hypothetical protein